MKKLNIIMNERIYNDLSFFYSENIDCKSIVEGLKEKFDIKLFARKTIIKQNNKLHFYNIFLSNNFLVYLFRVFLSLKNKSKSIYLIISITPYTFCAYLILFFFSKNIFLYLRSDGFKEYKSILGSRWVFLYSLMFYIFTKKVKIIACNNYLSKKKKFYYVKPSEIDEDWFLNRKEFHKNDKIKILYVGRCKVEKGIYNFLQLLNKINDSNISLSITCDKLGSIKIYEDRVKFLGYVSDKKELIRIYDNHDILILPSYTEAHPKVIDEALSRLKPVIIFNDIKHVINGRFGVFSLERDPNQLKNLIYYITNNYQNIISDIKKNKLPTKKNFLDNLANIINSN